jgi:transcriptional regulator with XRE-family HTH domain
MKMLGKQLARFREAAAHTQQSLADAVQVDVETIASIEQGRRALLPALAARLDEVLGTNGVLAVGVEHMPEIDLYPLWVEQFIAQESEALSLSLYANQVVPGLLQTETYARAVFRSRVPAYGPDEIDKYVRGRIERQDILHRPSPPTVSYVIWEPVLHFPVGGAEVHREQLRHLLTCLELPCLSVQFLKLDRTTHAALDGPFVLMETPEHQHIAYTETQRGSQWVEDPDEVSILARKYAMLRSQALPPEDSRDLLTRLLGER